MDESIGVKPINKVNYQAGVGTGLGLLFVWIYSELTGRQMPVEVALILAGLVGYLAGYITPLEQRVKDRLRRGNTTPRPLPTD